MKRRFGFAYHRRPIQSRALTTWREPLSKKVLIAGAVVLAAVVSVATLAATTWSGVSRVALDRATPEILDDPSRGESAAQDDPPPPPTRDGDGIDTFLLVGSDSRAGVEGSGIFGDFEGQRADVVMVLIRPEEAVDAALLSLPRDLWVEDLCRGGMTRLNEALEGCEAGANGPTLLTRTVEEVMGLPVDHFALIDFDGFQHAVDALGGYEICVERQVRDSLAKLELPAGCTLATGAQTLAWLRSRHTQELTPNGWRLLPGVNDLTRNERQREFLLDMLALLSDFGSPQDIASTARALAPHVTVDTELGFLDAVGIAWTMRGLGTGRVEQITVPVVDQVTELGAAVLVPTVEVAQLVQAFLAPETVDHPGGEFTS